MRVSRARAADRSFLAKFLSPSSLTGSLRLYLPANAVWRAVGLIRTVLLTWLMSTVEFGRFGLAMLLVNVVAPVAGLGLHETASRYVPAFQGRACLWPFVRRLLGLTTFAAGAAGLLLIVLSPWLAHRVFAPLSSLFQPALRDPMLITLTRWVGLTVFVLTLYQFVFGLLRGARMFLMLSLMECFSAMVFTALAVAVVVSGWSSASSVLVTYCVSLGLAGALFGVPALRWLHGESVRSENHSAEVERDVAGIDFGLWLAMAAVLWQLLQFVPVWMLNLQHGPEATAVFTAARQITQVVVVAAFAVGVTVSAAVIRRWETDGPEAADRQWALSFKVMSLALFLVAVVMTLSRSWIALTFEGNYRGGVASLMPVLLLFSMVAGSHALLTIHFALIERTRRVVVAWVLGIGTAFILGAAYIKDYGLLGAAWVATLAMIVTMTTSLVLLVVSRRRLDRGAVFLMVVPGLLIAPTSALIVGSAAVVLLSLTTSLILSAEEKHQLRTSVRRIVGAA